MRSFFTTSPSGSNPFWRAMAVRYPSLMLRKVVADFVLIAFDALLISVACVCGVRFHGLWFFTNGGSHLPDFH